MRSVSDSAAVRHFLAPRQATKHQNFSRRRDGECTYCVREARFPITANITKLYADCSEHHVVMKKIWPIGAQAEDEK